MHEVHSEDGFGLLGEELRPGRAGSPWRWIDSGRMEDLPDRRGRDVMSKPDQLALLQYLIIFLDEKGYLTTTLEEIAKSFEQQTAENGREAPAREGETPAEPHVIPLTRWEEALKMVQKLEPPGVGARDWKECLLLQLTPETPHRDVLRALIQNHMEDIEHNRLPVIQRKTGFDLTVIKEAIEVLKHLNLNPGSQFVVDKIPYVVPDIAVERTEAGDYSVRLLDDWTPNIYISRRYMEMYKDKRKDPKTREYLKKKNTAAQWLMESIEQRRSTLEKVTAPSFSTSAPSSTEARNSSNL